MARAFSLASWNVEHFRKDPERVERVIDFLLGGPPGPPIQPDVVALYEVEGKEVFRAVSQRMTGYTFHITEGPQAQEILVGVRSGITAFFTQRIEFKSAVSLLRPGALVTITIDGVDYPLLFLHTKSGNDPRGLGLRDDMLEKAVSFRTTLNKAADGMANYIFLGDLNTMGMHYKYVNERGIPADDELLKLSRKAARYGMDRLDKDATATWWGGSTSTYEPSDLDQVVAANHLEFNDFDGSPVTALGWPKEPTDEARDIWTSRFSDHACLYFEVQKPD